MSLRGLALVCRLVLLLATAASTGLQAQSTAPGIPVNLRVSAVGNTVTATWAAPLDGGAPLNYVVIARTPTGVPVVNAAVGNLTTVSGNVASGVYFVSVRAENNAGTSAETAPRQVSVAIGGVPGTPVNVSATGSGNIVHVAWDPPTTGGSVTNYIVTRRDVVSGAMVRINVGPATFSNQGARDGSFRYTVQATNAEGTSPESQPATISVPLPGAPAAGTPGMPVAFDTSASGNVLSLSWQPPVTGGVQTYMVIQRNAAGTVLNVFDMGNTLTFVGPVPHATYGLSVVAVNAAGGGPPTAIQTVVVPSSTNLPGPANLIGTVSGTTVTFRWTPGPGGVATQYILRATAVPGGPVVASLPTNGITSELSIQNVPPGIYFANVAGTNASGEGAVSNTVTVVVGGAATARSTLNGGGLAGNLDFRFSQAATSEPGSNSKTFDDFILGAGATIGTIRWQGAYCRQVNGGGVPAPTAGGFAISLHADDNGRPNAVQPLSTMTVPVAQVNQTFAGSRSGITCGNATNTTSAYYDYTLTLPSPIAIEGGQRYWLAIQAIVPTNATVWGWRGGLVDTRTTYQLVGTTLTLFTNDRAFALEP